MAEITESLRSFYSGQDKGIIRYLEDYRIPYNTFTQDESPYVFRNYASRDRAFREYSSDDEYSEHSWYYSDEAESHNHSMPSAWYPLSYYRSHMSFFSNCELVSLYTATDDAGEFKFFKLRYEPNNLDGITEDCYIPRTSDIPLSFETYTKSELEARGFLTEIPYWLKPEILTFDYHLDRNPLKGISLLPNTTYVLYDDAGQQIPSPVGMESVRIPVIMFSYLTNYNSFDNPLNPTRDNDTYIDFSSGYAVLHFGNAGSIKLVSKVFGVYIPNRLTLGNITTRSYYDRMNRTHIVFEVPNKGNLTHEDSQLNYFICSNYYSSSWIDYSDFKKTDLSKDPYPTKSFILQPTSLYAQTIHSASDTPQSGYYTEIKQLDSYKLYKDVTLDLNILNGYVETGILSGIYVFESLSEFQISSESTGFIIYLNPEDNSYYLWHVTRTSQSSRLTLPNITFVLSTHKDPVFYEDEYSVYLQPTKLPLTISTPHGYYSEGLYSSTGSLISLSELYIYEVCAIYCAKDSSSILPLGSYEDVVILNYSDVKTLNIEMSIYNTGDWELDDPSIGIPYPISWIKLRPSLSKASVSSAYFYSNNQPSASSSELYRTLFKYGNVDIIYDPIYKYVLSNVRDSKMNVLKSSSDFNIVISSSNHLVVEFPDGETSTLYYYQDLEKRPLDLWDRGLGKKTLWNSRNDKYLDSTTLTINGTIYYNLDAGDLNWKTIDEMNALGYYLDKPEEEGFKLYLSLDKSSVTIPANTTSAVSVYDPDGEIGDCTQIPADTFVMWSDEAKAYGDSDNLIGSVTISAHSNMDTGFLELSIQNSRSSSISVKYIRIIIESIQSSVTGYSRSSAYQSANQNLTAGSTGNIYQQGTNSSRGICYYEPFHATSTPIALTFLNNASTDLGISNIELVKSTWNSSSHFYLRLKNISGATLAWNRVSVSLP